jgi:hypothetical protein
MLVVKTVPWNPSNFANQHFTHAGKKDQFEAVLRLRGKESLLKIKKLAVGRRDGARER